MAECFVCWNCIDDCPEGALRWQWFPPREKTIAAPDISKRALLTSVVGGAAGLVALRLCGANYHRGHTMRIRPPGALAEDEFLKRCIKCGECMKVCPTNVIQPALTEAGIEGLWTPVMNMQTGYCELNCTLCGQACPTGAIQRMTIADKTGVPDSTPVKIGTAFVDRSRCIPWSLGRDCLVCQEVCPVSPKAIYDIKGTVEIEGAARTLRRPQVDPARCIGCGLCQHECPVNDKPAIRVSAAGESRSPGGGFFL
jgi:formate hydrogenlyase subunit 6/NADH:ubiquinone oxidoreductase subunit I